MSLRIPQSLSSRGLIVALVSLVSLIVLALLPTSASAVEDETIGISLRTADAAGAYDGRTNFRYAMDPGQTVSDYAAVVNTGVEPQVFTLLGTDAFNNDAGEFALLPTAEEPELLGRYVTFENGTNRMEVTLGPGEGRLVPFTLALPAEATPGDHAAGIVASVLSAAEQVELDRRVAIRLYVRVSGDLQPRLAISGLEASYAGDWWNPFAGEVTVRYTVDNPGNVALAGNVDGGINTWFGIPLNSPSGGAIREILPGNSASFEYQAPGIAQLLYLNAHVTVAPFVDNDDPSTYVTVPSTTRDAVAWAIPWLLVIAIVIGVGIWFLLRWRRKRDEKRAEEWIAYTQAQARAEAEKDASLVGAGAGSATDGADRT